MAGETLVLSRRKSRVAEGSCWTCRRRRLKCDLQRPACAQCASRELACSYSLTPPIKWIGGAATRGRFANFPSPETPETPYSTSPGSQPLEPGEIILYFANAVLPRFQIPNDPIVLDYDVVSQDEPLQQAIVAVSQAHYALHSKVDIYDVSLLRKRAKQTAIEGFRKCLEQGVYSETSAQRLFAINILLCILDGMIQPEEDINASMCHLRGGFAILQQWTNTPTRMLLQDGLQAHLLSIYTTMDLVHALLSGEKPFFESITWKMFADAQTWFGRLQKGDRFLEILAAFSEMAALGNIVRDNLPDDSSSLMEKCLGSVETVFSGDANEYTRQHTVHTPWTLFCSVYEICGFIYLQRALRLHSLAEERTQVAVRRGVEMLIDDRLPNMMQHCVIFPLLVIGSHCTLTQDRKAILEVLSSSSSYLSFGNMTLMATFLKSNWSSSDPPLNWWECFASVSQKAFLF
jgi:hypothetical protein